MTLTEWIFQTPGAGTYKITPINIYKEALPTYSITARHQLPTDSTRKPGPGAYKPETVSQIIEVHLKSCKILYYILVYRLLYIMASAISREN